MHANLGDSRMNIWVLVLAAEVFCPKQIGVPSKLPLLAVTVPNPLGIPMSILLIDEG